MSKKRHFVLASLLVCALGSARAADRVNVGIINSLSDAPVFMAEERGYFHEQGLDARITSMDSAGKMIAPLGSGELDVGGGASSAGLFNAVERGIGIRIVADRTTTWPESDYQMLVVRKDLVTSGRVKSLADLKGLKFAVAAPGIAILSVLNEAAKAGGLRYDDIQKVFLPFPQQLAAFANGAIDGSVVIEPYGTILLNAGTAAKLVNTEAFYPRDEIGLVYFSEDFAQHRGDVATRYMTALLHATRDYMASVKNGHIQGPGSDFVLGVLVRHFNLSPELARQVSPQRVDLDGRVNMASLKLDWEFYRDQGMIKGTVPPEKVVDMRFADAAAKALGPAQP
jgi:NitT/TauT family transport system substrate-binding protein